VRRVALYLIDSLETHRFDTAKLVRLVSAV
jgi:hypothetical protein